MKRIFSILVLIMLVGCSSKEQEINQTAPMKLMKSTSYKQVTVIDNFEVIYQKAGFLEVKQFNIFGLLTVIDHKVSGDYKTSMRAGWYATIIIEECVEGQEPLYDEVGLKYYEEQKSAEEHE